MTKWQAIAEVFKALALLAVAIGQLLSASAVKQMQKNQVDFHWSQTQLLSDLKNQQMKNCQAQPKAKK